MPDTTLDMQGIIGVPSDVKLKDVFNNIKRWHENNSENFDSIKKMYEIQRKNKSKT